MGTGSLPEAWTASDYINLAQISEFFLVLMADFWQTECLYTFRCQDKHCKQVKCVISNQWSYIVVFLPVYWPRQYLQPFHGVVKCTVLLQDKVWQRLWAVSSSTCFHGTNTHFCRETGYIANTRFSGLVWTQIWLRYLRFDSDLTQISGQKKDG